MIENETAKRTAVRLRRLIEKDEISRSDRHLAERCLRRIEHPLRLTLFGTDPQHAISLLNLMIGQPVVSPSIPRARIQFFHSEVPHARLQFRDGTQKRIEGAEFRNLFADNPSRVRICLDLPVLKKLSIILATDSDPDLLCSDAEKTMPGADISIWAGGDFGGPMLSVWRNLPDRLRDHSYLVFGPKMDVESWAEIEGEFVEVLRVDPRRAQEAKSRKGGVDKASFRDSGGAQIVKTIKKEIELLTQSALDAGEVLLARFADQIEDSGDVEGIEETSFPEVGSAQLARSVSTPVAERKLARETDPKREQEIEEILAQVKSRPVREQVYSVQLGKLASRSRLLGSSGGTPQSKAPQRTVSQAIKNMPKRVSMPVSKSLATRRVRSRKSRPSATPWSLGL